MDWNKWAAETIRVAQGHAGETRFRDRLVKKKVPHMQVDVLMQLQGGWALVEVKHQERFVNPDGHGMPEWQVDKRMEFYRDTGIVPWLVVVEQPGQRMFTQSIPELEKNGRALVTKKSRRVIWPLSSFSELKD
jgi:hypothetical protein